MKYREECKESFKELKIPTLYSIYILHCLLYIKENESKYISRDRLHPYPTRSNDNLHFDFRRLSKSRNGTAYYAVKFYNALPLNIRRLDHLRFKTVLKKFLTDNAFFSINEFLDADFSVLCR